jgi:hypothetical protein
MTPPIYFEGALPAPQHDRLRQQFELARRAIDVCQGDRSEINLFRVRVEVRFDRKSSPYPV